MAKKKKKKKSSKSKSSKSDKAMSSAKKALDKAKSMTRGSSSSKNSSSSSSKNSSSSSSKSSSKSTLKTKTSTGYETPQQTIDRVKAAMKGPIDEKVEKKEKKEEKPKNEAKPGVFDESKLTGSAEFKDLPPDEQEAVLNIFRTIAENNSVQAEKLTKAFEVASQYANPIFKQKLRLAKDELQRGFVEITKEKEFKEKQARKRLEDLRMDVATKKNLLTLEEMSDLKEIERAYTETLTDTRQDLAASGLGSSSRRVEKERLLEETTGDLRESTRRRFGSQIEDIQTGLVREERDTTDEIQRLTEVARSGKIDLFRRGEELLGTGNLPALEGLSGLGDVVGTLEQDRMEDTISGVKNLLF